MLKYQKFAVILSLACFGLAEASDATEITSQNAPILYEVKADIPTPTERIAEAISADYRALRDEFSKHDFLEKLKPIIERRIREAGETKSFSLVVGTRLDEYDFNRKAFPTGTGPQSFIPLGDYAARFSNADAVGFVGVPFEEAKKVSAALKASRQCTITYVGTLEKSAEEDLNYSTYKILYLKVKKVTIRLENSGTEFVQDIP